MDRRRWVCGGHKRIPQRLKRYLFSITYVRAEALTLQKSAPQVQAAEKIAPGRKAMPQGLKPDVFSVF
jgi:hypothetical protein